MTAGGGTGAPQIRAQGVVIAQLHVARHLSGGLWASQASTGCRKKLRRALFCEPQCLTTGKAGNVSCCWQGRLTDSTMALIAPASIAKVDPQEKVGAPHCAK